MKLTKNKNIIIISLEGIESNTEVNFFKGFLCYEPNGLNGVCVALGKLSEKRSMKEKYKNRIKSFVLENSEFLKNCAIFFIGDGKPQSDIPSMERAREFTIKELNKVENIESYSKLIYDKNKNFEEILLENNKIKESKIFKNNNQKKKSNVNLFNNIIKVINHKMANDEKEKIKLILFEIFKNSKLKEIINFIYN